MSRLTKICDPSKGYAGTHKLNTKSDTFSTIACTAIANTKFSLTDTDCGPINHSFVENLTTHDHANTIGTWVSGPISDTSTRPFARCQLVTFPSPSAPNDTLLQSQQASPPNGHRRILSALPPKLL